MTVVTAIFSLMYGQMTSFISVKSIYKEDEKEASSIHVITLGEVSLTSLQIEVLSTEHIQLIRAIDIILFP